MGRRPYIPIDDLRQKYENGASFRDLANEYKCSDGLIRTLFKENNIKSRKWARDLPDESIIADYLEGHTQGELAAKYGCSQFTIHARLSKHGVKLRPISEIMKGKQCSLGVKHDEAFCQRISERSKNRKWMDTSRDKLSAILKTRWAQPGYREAHSGENSPLKRPDVRAKISGKNAPCWHGGVSFGRYCPAFNRQMKESIRNKFDRSCFLCGDKENGRKLHVHHVDYNKSQGCKGLKWALIPLCITCHHKTNYHRWYWFALLRDYWIYEYIEFFNF